jgi:tetratricopeptide (TPR) repeat protein
MNPAQLRDQAHAALRQGDITLAKARFHDAVQASAGNARLLRELGGSLWALYDFTAALDAYRCAAQAEPQSTESHLLAAQKLFSIARFRECAAWLEQARALNPHDATLLTMLGEVYDRNNRLDDAERCALEALTIAPRKIETVRLMAHLERRRGQLDHARVRLTQHLRQCPSLEDWRLRYELAAVLDRLGEYDAAMAELFAAKAQLEPQARPQIGVAHAIRHRQREVAELLDAADWTAWQARPASLHPLARIAFLCGHPRSGTTLFEQILDAHPDIVTTDETGILAREFIEPIIRQPLAARAGVDELRSFDAEQLAAGRETYFQFTQEHLGASIGGRLLIEKDPGLTPDLPLPLRLFPEARVIFPLRDPRDVCVSYFFTLLPLNPASVAAIDLKSTIECCAHSLRLWLHWRETIPQPWLELRYEALVARPEPEMRRILGFLDVPWDQRLLRFHERATEKGVRTPTYADVIQPLYQRAVGRWRNYERYLAPHLDLLRPWLRAFGYE